MLTKKRIIWYLVVCSVSLAGAWGQSPSQRALNRTGAAPAMVAEPVAPDATAAPAAAEAVVPRIIKFSGTLRDLVGKPISGPVDITFSLYSDETGGSPLWFETQTVVADALGRYTVLLGAMSPQGVPIDLFASGEAHWLGAQVGTLPEQARVLLVSVPYALKAGDAETLGGKPASAYLLANSSGSNSTTNATLSNLVQASALTSGGRITPLALTATQNYIPVMTDNSGSLGNSVMYQSGSFIGFNTTAPSFGIDLNSNVFAIGTKTAAPGAGGSMRFRDDTGTVRWLFGIPGSAGSTDFFMYNMVNGHAPLYFQAGAPSYGLYFAASGNVGVETNTPSFGLDVNSNVIAVGTQTAKPGSGGTMRFRDDTGTVRWALGIPGSAGATDFFVSNLVTAQLPFYIQAAAPSNTLYLNGTGNVGIGTAAPAQKLTVAGNVKIAGTGNALIFPDGTVMTSAGAGTNGGTITAVNPGAGLSGGGTSGSVTLSLASASCAAGQAVTALPLACQSFATQGANSYTGNQTVTGNLSASGTVTGSQLISTVATGTPPLSVASTTQVPNLNASLLGGLSASSFAGLGANAFTGDQTVSGNVSASGGLTAGSASVTGTLSAGQSAFAASNSTQAVSIQQSGSGTALTTFADNALLGIFASANSTNGVGIEGSIGVAISAPTQTAGVLGVNNAANGIGVNGIAENASGVAGLFNNTVSGGKVLSGQANGTEVFAVSYAGGVSAKSVRPALNTVAFAATAVFDASLGNTQKMTLTGNVTSFTIPNAAAGQTIRFIWVQDATGGRTVSGGPSMKGFTSPGTNPSSYSIQACTYDGSTWVCEPAATNL